MNADLTSRTSRKTIAQMNDRSDQFHLSTRKNQCISATLDLKIGLDKRLPATIDSSRDINQIRLALITVTSGNQGSFVKEKRGGRKR